MPSSVLVTGDRGFIGQHLVKALRNRYVYGFDKNDKLIDNCEGIIHLAAVSRAGEGEEDPVKCLETNILLTARVLELNFSWFVLAGTQELPGNVYGLSKRFAEDYVALMARKKGFRFGVVKFPVVYGPGDNENKLIPSVRRGSEVKDGALPITAVHVSDAVRRILDEVYFLESQVIVDSQEKLKRVAHSY